MFRVNYSGGLSAGQEITVGGERMTLTVVRPGLIRVLPRDGVPHDAGAIIEPVQATEPEAVPEIETAEEVTDAMAPCKAKFTGKPKGRPKK